MDKVFVIGFDKNTEAVTKASATAVLLDDTSYDDREIYKLIFDESLEISGISFCKETPKKGEIGVLVPIDVLHQFVKWGDVKTRKYIKTFGTHVIIDIRDWSVEEMRKEYADYCDRAIACYDKLISKSTPIITIWKKSLRSL